MQARNFCGIGAIALLSFGCSGSAQPGTDGQAPGTPGTVDPGPGTAVTLTVPAELSQADAATRQKLAAVKELTAADLASQYSATFEAGPEYDTANIPGLSMIQSSPLSLNDAEVATLGKRGFVISERHAFPSFVYGYQTLYMADLPLYVSADSILFAVHRSYDSLLKALEADVLHSDLSALLAGMHATLAAGSALGASEQALADADLFVSVARSLLGNAVVEPTYAANREKVQAVFNKASKAEGSERLEIFGSTRDEDFSQYKPRGHYTDSELLERYFRATMWLGRIDFRILETQSDGTQLFRRRQLEGALVLRELIDQALRFHFDRIDQVVTAFVGEHDYMVLSDLDKLLLDMNVKSLGELAAVDDTTIAQAMVNGGYGAQRISSHIMINGLDSGTLPLSKSFALLGQRYVVDSHVFSNVVYDRVTAKRMMPSSLDVAFAALGNNQALTLLTPELEKYPYASALASMRLLVDEHPTTFWSSNLYNGWLGAVRELSPEHATALANNETLPKVARTEAWGRRLLNTQLASWAELRHDTILYAKQSYTSGAACEFPDAYVDPYPEFYAKIAAYANFGKELMLKLNLTQGGYIADAAVNYFTSLEKVAIELEGMAKHELTGAAFTQPMLDFINQAVKIQMGCGEPMGMEGWYAKLFFNPIEGIEFDPTIADVHTQPTDEVGNMVGRVLHVGTGKPRLMVVAAEGCSGPRAYAGLVSSYFERTTENFERLDDPTWAKEIEKTTPADVPWMSDLVSR